MAIVAAAQTALDAARRVLDGRASPQSSREYQVELMRALVEQLATFSGTAVNSNATAALARAREILNGLATPHSSRAWEERLFAALCETIADFAALTGFAPKDAEYITNATNATLTAERVLTDNADIVKDVSVASQVAFLFADLAARTVMGRGASTSGHPGGIVAASGSGFALRENGLGALGFGELATAALLNNAVTDAKLRQSGACSLVGRSANSTGDVADIAAAANNQVLARKANALSFENVSDAMLSNMGACSVKGRSANSSGSPSDIAASTNSQYLQRASNALTFAVIPATDLPNQGSYSPTRSAEANMDANVTFATAYYTRVGDWVDVRGRFTANPTLTATATSFEMTLPVSSNIGAVGDVTGQSVCSAIAGMVAGITGSILNNTAVVAWISSDINSQTWEFRFAYKVI